MDAPGVRPRVPDGVHRGHRGHRVHRHLVRPRAEHRAGAGGQLARSQYADQGGGKPIGAQPVAEDFTATSSPRCSTTGAGPTCSPWRSPSRRVMANPSIRCRVAGAARHGDPARGRRLRHRLFVVAYLRRLPIDEIKIDKSFVQGMVTDLSDHGHRAGDHRTRPLARAGRVVAEGVEEEAARDALRALTCDEMQGFLLARPMPIERFEAWLTTRNDQGAADRLAGAGAATPQLTDIGSTTSGPAAGRS